jgi:hypothetical protein
MQAQETENSTTEKMNIVKTNVTAYAFRNINLSYERAINQWFSLNIGFGTMPEGKVPFINAFLKDKDEKRFENLRVKATNFTIEQDFILVMDTERDSTLLLITVILMFPPIHLIFIMIIMDPMENLSDPAQRTGKHQRKQRRFNGRGTILSDQKPESGP